jgi:hypothetical protein
VYAQHVMHTNLYGPVYVRELHPCNAYVFIFKCNIRTSDLLLHRSHNSRPATQTQKYKQYLTYNKAYMYGGYNRYIYN